MGESSGCRVGGRSGRLVCRFGRYPGGSDEAKRNVQTCGGVYQLGDRNFFSTERNLLTVSKETLGSAQEIFSIDGGSISGMRRASDQEIETF